MTDSPFGGLTPILPSRLHYFFGLALEQTLFLQDAWKDQLSDLCFPTAPRIVVQKGLGDDLENGPWIPRYSGEPTARFFGEKPGEGTILAYAPKKKRSRGVGRNLLV